MEDYPDFFTENLQKNTPIALIEAILPTLENKIDTDIIKKFCGPIRENSSKENIYNNIVEYLKQTSKGTSHIYISELQKKYGDRGEDTNILIPILSVDENKVSYINYIILVCDQGDAQTISRNHIKKMPNFKPIVGDSIISTTDNEHWRRQRNNLNSSFMPITSIKPIFNKSLKLSDMAVTKLNEILQNTNLVDMNEFLLGETQEQLQRILIGLPQEFTKKNNKLIRMAFSGKGKKGFTRELGLNILDLLPKLNGPIPDILNNYKPTTHTENYGNIILLLFAGHDTTGHTLTWLLYELAKNHNLQDELYHHISDFLASYKLEYKNLDKLHLLTRYITETLRLWPAVANGTYRQLGFNEYINGCNGEKIKLAKGCYCQMPNWIRHRSKKVWGKDADIFNPKRKFEGDELWNDNGFSGYNPSSARFSPFSYSPRDCLGKNFAQLEMRLLLIKLITNFKFSLSEKNLKNENYYGMNRATLGPEDLSIKQEGLDNLLPDLNLGCHFIVTKRFISKI